MIASVVVVYHSRSGRTRALAEAVVRGASEVSGIAARAYDVEAVVPQDELAHADAIVLGCPTYMGSASAPFKAFMDASAPIWALQGWRDKLAAGFTHSAAPSGDKLGTLLQLALFAAQHGMVWVGLGLPPSYASADRTASGGDVNRLGSHLGAMAQTPPGRGGVSEGDMKTCEHLGRRVAELAMRHARGAAGKDDPSHEGRIVRHASAATWAFPPEARAPLPGIARVNLRELAARPGRFEHHLTVVARAGKAQLEIATASEPLAFAHVNISDEYAAALPTGDDVIDRFPLRTFVADAATGEDAARYNHRVLDLVLHPFGWLHWPGRMRPPFEPFVFPAGMRRCGVTVVCCASSPTPPGRERPPGVGATRDVDAKSYREAPPPLGLADLGHEAARIMAQVGRASLALVVDPPRIDAPRGAYVLVLEAAADSAHFACDLLHLSPGSSLDGAGITRALVLSDAVQDTEPPPVSWERLPESPIASFAEARRIPLPLSRGGITLTKVDDARVTVAVGTMQAVVPRHWLARMLFRVALHRPLLGYVETYGGFFFDDREGVVFGLRGAGATERATVDPAALLVVVEALYLAAAPPGYVEL